MSANAKIRAAVQRAIDSCFNAQNALEGKDIEAAKAIVQDVQTEMMQALRRVNKLPVDMTADDDPIETTNDYLERIKSDIKRPAGFMRPSAQVITFRPA